MKNPKEISQEGREEVDREHDEILCCNCVHKDIAKRQQLGVLKSVREKVEGMRKKTFRFIERPTRWDERVEREWEYYLMDNGYNQALTDLTSWLDEQIKSYE